MLHIINNSTGDQMSFDVGRKLAEADDVKIATLVAEDDVAVNDPRYTDMAAASLTLVKLDDELNRLFDAPAEVAERVF